MKKPIKIVGIDKEPVDGVFVVPKPKQPKNPKKSVNKQLLIDDSNDN